jgi:hypothetical protein
MNFSGSIQDGNYLEYQGKYQLLYEYYSVWSKWKLYVTFDVITMLRILMFFLWDVVPCGFKTVSIFRTKEQCQLSLLLEPQISHTISVFSY